MATDNDKLFKDAQFRKNAFIAFFNANNAAVEMVKLEGPQFEKKKIPKKGKTPAKVVEVEVPYLERLNYWRNESLNEYNKYCNEVIAGIGVNYNIEDSLNKLKKAKNIDELKKAWLLLSADERQDPEILKVKGELKKLYEKVQ